VVERIGDELVIYDEDGQVAHACVPTVAAIWESCDGSRTVAQLAARCGVEPALAQQAVDELWACGLLDDAPASAEGISRREASRRLLGAGAAALGGSLILSAAIPASAAAVSYCSANCATGTQIAASSCPAYGPGYSVDTTVCQSGFCYESVSGSYSCVPLGCYERGLLGCSPNNNGLPTCCAGQSACQYVPSESAYGCYY
jgi:hypothetical protein